MAAQDRRTTRRRALAATLATAFVAGLTTLVAAPTEAGTLQPQPDTYVPITPCRIVDTRQAEGRFDDREIRDYTVSGGGPMFANQGGKEDGCDIPLGITAVEATVTAVDPLDSGFFRAWPNGQSMPNATFMNFDEGMDISNTGSITVNGGLSSTGADATTSDFAAPQLRARNFGGESHYVIDVQGYWIAPKFASPGTDYTAITPCRVLDTRQVGDGTQKIADRQILDINVSFSSSVEPQGGKTGGCDIPTTATGIEASVSAVDPDGSGFFRAWPANQSMPNATFMNFDTGMDITNTGSLTLAPLGSSGAAATSDLNPAQIRLRNFGSPSHYVVDVQGYFTPRPNEEGAATSAAEATTGYVPITPCRVVDTRQALGSLGDREIRDIAITVDSAIASQGGKDGGCDIPAGTAAVEASITAVDPLDSGFFRAWPFGESMPNATFMNFDQGMDITNTGSIAIDSAPVFNLAETNGGIAYELRMRNFGGRSHYVVDIQGYYPLNRR